ncbi:hypothetical protein [Streptomyces sp. NPDC058011]|uniref:hypothetical protein n=1 Tax=Streptomyces sp. NPDC058011 TaxID=3346305 RepID=UPI0036E802F1
MELSSDQVGTLSALLCEGSKLDSNSAVGALVQWRTAAAVYLRGAVSPEHYVWKVLPDIDQYELPYAMARDRAFAENWAPLLGALQGLLLLHTDTEGRHSPDDDDASHQDWWPAVMAAIQAKGPAGLRTGDVAVVAQRDRKTVRVHLQAAVLRGELGYVSNGPQSAYVAVDHDLTMAIGP